MLKKNKSHKENEFVLKNFKHVNTVKWHCKKHIKKSLFSVCLLDKDDNDIHFERK
jgi:hypothetical protein